MTREEMLKRLEVAHGTDSENYTFFEERMYETENLDILFNQAYNLTEWD